MNAEIFGFGPVSKPVAAFALLAVGVAPPLAPSPYQPTHIERVIENAGRFLGITADRGSVPLATPGSGNAVKVQPSGNLNRRGPCGELGKYAPDNHGEWFIDLEQPTDEFAFGIEFDNAFECVCATTGKPSRKDCGFHAAYRFVDEMFQENRAQQSSDSELDLIDMAFADGVQRDAVNVSFLPSQATASAPRAKRSRGSHTIMSTAPVQRLRSGF